MKRRKGKLDMEALLEQRRPGRLIEPPREVVARAVALGRGTERGPEGVFPWLLRLVFDSARTPAVAGVRGAAPAGERRLLYEISSDEGLRQLDVRLRRLSGEVEVVGQLLPPMAGVWVELRLGRAKAKANLGDHGEFQVSVATGRTPVAVLSLRRDESTLLVLDNVAIPTGTGTASA